MAYFSPFTIINGDGTTRKTVIDLHCVFSAMEEEGDTSKLLLRPDMCGPQPVVHVTTLTDMLQILNQARPR